jgi:hypothetical protein
MQLYSAIFCDKGRYIYFAEYINSINSYLNYNLVLYEDKYLNFILQKNNYLKIIIFVQIIPEHINKNLLNKKFYCVINTEQYTSTNNNYLNCNNNIIIDYSNENILYAKQNLEYKKYIFFPYVPMQKEILNFTKIYDVCLVGTLNSRRQYIINQIRNLGIKINVISDLFGKERDDVLFKHKILVNIHSDIDYQIYESIRCDRCLFNKIIIISEKSLFCKKNMLKKFIIFRKYENISKITLKILQKYDYYYDKIFNNYDNFFQKYNKKIKNIHNKVNLCLLDSYNKNLNKKIKLCFIIIRYVRDNITNKYWQESYNCIRKYYNDKIIIIDDNSDKKFLKNEIKLENYLIINSQFPQRGEILGYYYFWRLKLYDKAVIIHDSVFIKKYINFQNYEDSFLWSFKHDYDDNNHIRNIMTNIKKNNKEIKNFYNKKDKWFGCFGIMSVVNLETINKMNKRYLLFESLLPIIKTRYDRMAMERIIACMFYLVNNKYVYNIFGDINEYCEWGITFEEYLEEYIGENLGEILDLPVVKVWTGR